LKVNIINRLFSNEAIIPNGLGESMNNGLYKKVNTFIGKEYEFMSIAEPVELPPKTSALLSEYF
jgi:hypothetical protein